MGVNGATWRRVLVIKGGNACSDQRHRVRAAIRGVVWRCGVSQIDFRKSCMVAENKKRERWDWHGEWVERDCRSGGREVMVGSVSVGGDI